MNSYMTKYYFLGTDGNVDYYLAEPKANKTTITNYCEVNCTLCRSIGASCFTLRSISFYY